MPFTTFQEIAAHSGSDKPFIAATQEIVDLLEKITSVEKAQAVPFAKMWQVNAKTGEPIHGVDGVPTAPLNMIFAAPPLFGAVIEDPDMRFRERPPVSLEKIVIKSVAPKGLIQYRELHISFMVHRPDVIFGEKDPTRDNWSELITPGSVFAMEYGWNASLGVSNGILNGEGLGPVPGVKRINFVIKNYQFKINANGEIHVDMTALDSGEFQIRRAVIGDDSTYQSKDKHLLLEDVKDSYSKEEQGKILREFQSKIGSMKKEVVAGQLVVKFREIANKLMSDVIEKALRATGFKNVSLVIGDFNSSAGKTIKMYGGKLCADQSIGDFVVPVKMLNERISNAINSGKQQTIYNFVSMFLDVFNNPEIWERSGKESKQGDMTHNPQIRMKLMTNPGKSNATLYIIDLEREVIKFAKDSKEDFAKTLAGARPTRDKIREALRKRGVPMITFVKGNSFIKDCNFEAIQHDMIKSLFIMRSAVDYKTRGEITSEPDKATKTKKVDPRQVLYSGAIKGTITMLGNFAFDVFSVVWLDFGIPRWDGPFTLQEVIDVIENGEFSTQLTLWSAGIDPLGTQRQIFEEKEREAGREKT